MRAASVIVVVFSSAAIAQTEGEETRDLPLPSMSAPATGGGNPLPEYSLPRERAGPAPAQTHCYGEWVLRALPVSSERQLRAGQLCLRATGWGPLGRETLSKRKTLLSVQALRSRLD